MGVDTHKRVGEYVKLWESRCYPDGIPDEAPKDIFEMVPSYKRICLAILNNDLQLTSLGYTAKHSKYYSILKQIEIKNRTVIKQIKS